MGESENFFAATHSLLLTVNHPNEYRSALISSFQASFDLYSELFDLLTDQAYYKRADPLRHPLIFYYGHTSVFTINKLVISKNLGIYDRIDSKIESLCAIGVDEMSWDDLPGEDFDWPSVEEVRQYREKVLERVKCYIRDELPLSPNSTIDWEHPAWVLMMCLEHEKIHLETSAVLIRQLPLELLKQDENNIFVRNICKNYEGSPDDAMARLKEIEYIQLSDEPVKVQLGRESVQFESKQKCSYGWDNEYGSDEIEMAPGIKIGNRMISNAEFLEFIKNGGYEAEELWSKEGWQWVTFTKSKHPRFWRLNEDGSYKLRLLSTELGMPWDWPVECNYLEASAYCKYMSKKDSSNYRIMKECEYAYARQQAEAEIQYEDGIGSYVPLAKAINLAMQKFTSCNPVDINCTKLNGNNIYDLQGNTWEHIRSTIYPFHGFRPHPVYDDFTIPTFDDRHDLILGGSWISCGNEANPYARYAFRRHFYQFAGFRLVLDPGPQGTETEFDAMNAAQKNSDSDGSVYETDMLLHQYVNFHYGQLPPYPQLKGILNYPQACADVCLALAEKIIPRSDLRVLDVGAGVCRSTFELAKSTKVREVVGLDFSSRFIQAAHQLKQQKRLQYYAVKQGDLWDYKDVQLKEKRQRASDLVLDGTETRTWIKSGFEEELSIESSLAKILTKCEFLQGDACNLSKTHHLLRPDNKFDLILAANLIDRLYEPKAFLESIGEHMAPGGLLVISSPYTWLEEYTPKDKWIGARKVNGENTTTLEALWEVLQTQFIPLSLHGNVSEIRVEGDHNNAFTLPFVIPETERKFQLSFAQVSIWKKL